MIDLGAVNSAIAELEVEDPALAGAGFSELRATARRMLDKKDLYYFLLGHLYTLKAMK